MDFFSYFEKFIYIITPSFNQSSNLKRYERLSKFFEERKRINNLNESQKVKTILLNSAAAALTGVRNAKIEELEYFLDTFDANDFEIKYWAFVRNRVSYIITKNSKGKILYIHSIKKGRIKIRTLNIFIITIMFLAPFAFLTQRESFLTIPGVSDSIWNIFILGIIGVCVLIIIKAIYDWSYWSDLNEDLKKMKFISK